MKWLLILIPSMLMAGIWPSQDSIMQGGFDRGNQVLSGAVERLTVVLGATAWTNFATTNIFADYFKQRTKVVAAKAMIGAAVDTGRFVFPDDPYTPTGAVVVTKSNLAVRAGVGQDWWTNTPFFNLASDTNGFRFIPAVMSNVVWIGHGGYGIDNGNYTLHRGSGDSWDYLTNPVSVAIAEAVANYPSDGGDHQGHAFVYDAFIQGVTENDGVPRSFAFMEQYYSYHYFWYFVLDRVQNDVWANGFGEATNAAAACTFYAKVYPIVDYTDGYDSQGDNVDTNYLAYTNWTRLAGDNKGPAVTIGDIGDADAPVEYAEEQDSWYSAKGWRFGDGHTLHRFNDPALTGGFQWFR